MSDDDDPFEAFEPAEDREGDPFERLDDPESDDADSGDGAGEREADDGPDSDEPVFEEEFIDRDDPVVGGPGTTPSGDRHDDEPDRSNDGPDEDLFEAIGGEDDLNEPTSEEADLFEEAGGGDDPFTGMAGRDGDPFGEGENVFESVDVESVDPDEVWASLDEEPTTATVEGSRYVEVSKHRFCEQCEFFSSPPNAHCTHDEAELVEYLDMETVRLLNCPVVAEQRQLENEE